MRRIIAASLISLVSSAAAVQLRVATFNIGAHFTTEGFPDYSLGDPGTSDHDSVRDVLDRIDADVVALEEIASADVSGNPDDLDNLAATLGYPYLYVAPVTAASPLPGPIDTTLRVAFLSRYPFITSTSVRSPAGAKELTRLHPVVKVDVPGTINDPVLISAHLKSGTAAADKFRRAVDFKRLVTHLNGMGLTNDDNYIIMGDFNLSSSNATYSTLPANLPVSYALGADIPLPVSYSTNPLTYFTTPSVTKLSPKQVNGSSATFQSGSVIDLVMVSPAIAGRPIQSEVYNSALDTSNSVGLPKAGMPLASGTSAAASDHYAVFADLELDSDFPNLALSVSTSSVNEGAPDGQVFLTVSLPVTRTSAVTIDLASDDAAATPLSTSVVIPAGSLSAAVGLNVPRDFLAGSQHSVTFTASAIGFDPASVVLQVNNVDGPYVLAAAGQAVTEEFSGFTGTQAPSPWATSGGSWQGTDDGSSSVQGFRAYGTAPEGSLGFLSSGTGGTAGAGFVNQTGAAIRSLRVSFDVEAWRVPANGAADGISAALVIDGLTVPIPSLSFVAGQNQAAGSVPLKADVSGFTIPAGASFELRISFDAGATSGAPPADVFVNEFHYDNASTDTGEFVEVVVGPGYQGTLSNLSLVIYNGSNGHELSTHTLDTFTTGETTTSGYRLFSKFIAPLQNDSEGFAITSGASVLNFISYEGSFTATTGVATGMVAINVNLTQNGSDLVGMAALGRSGSGAVGSDFSWTKFSGIAHSPGAVNSGQTFVIPTLPSRGLSIDNLSVTVLADADGDGIVDSLDPDDDNDGQLDSYELAFGSDPFVAASKFVTQFARVSPGNLQLSFPSAAGIQYTVETSVNLSTWTPLSVYAGTGNVIQVPLTENGARRFYRVSAPVPP